MSADSRWFEPDGRPRYGPLTQLEWYEQVRLELEGHAVCEANMDAEVERLQAEARLHRYDDDELDRLRAERNQYAIDAANALQEVDRMRAAVSGLHGEVDNSDAEVERLRAEAEAAAASWHDLRAHADRLEAEAERLRATQGGMAFTAELARLEGEVERLADVADTLELRIRGEYEENERLRAERQEMFEAWQAELSVVERLRADSRNERERLKTEIRRLRFRSVEYAAAVTNAETLKAEVARLRALRMSLADDMTRLTDEVERLRQVVRGCPLCVADEFPRASHEDEYAQEPSCSRCGAGVWAGCACYEDEDV